MIEDALRDTFAARAAGDPSPDAAERALARADLAIAGAARARRRHLLGTTLAGVVVLAIASALTLQALDSGPGRPMYSTNDLAGPPRIGSPSPAATGLANGGASPTNTAPMPIEVVSGGEIYTEGKSQGHFTLPDKGGPSTISRAYRTSDGYLVVVELPDLAQQLLLLDKGGNSSVLLRSAAAIAVSSTGDKVAWRAGDDMSVADRQPDKPALGQPFTTKAPQLGAPVSFLGANVVLGRSKADGGGLDAFDLWYPARTYSATWDESVVRTFGTRPDGSAMYAQVRDATDPTKICLALLVPAAPFKVTAKSCGVPEPAVVGGGVSPDGRWLAYPVASAAQIAMLDLKQAFSGGAPKPQVWNLKTASVRTVWLNPNALVVDTGGKFVTLDPNQPTKQEQAAGSSTGKVLIEPLQT
jgi:hypothetical protein